MNSPRDPWADFSEVFAEELSAPLQPTTPAALESMREQYEREQIAGAQSEAAHAANVKEYSK